MNRSQIIGWFVIAATIFCLACATSVIDDAAGARTLTRGALFWYTAVVIYFFWHEFPSVEPVEHLGDEVTG